MREEFSRGRREFLKTGVSTFLTLPALGSQKESEIPIVVGKNASPIEKLAADELAQHLRRLDPSKFFPIRDTLPGQGTQILLGTFQSLPELRSRIPSDLLARPGSYAATSQTHGRYQEGIVAGSDAQATLFAVYALLEKLGYGFYLSYSGCPQPSPESTPLGSWSMSDYPLVQERIAFTWHNFLSSCSTWNLTDWEHWIVQLSRMRFSSIMVHAYGNNPMFTFSHNGETKPVGYLATSTRGRDWGTEHVNDVRRIIGGDRIFDRPVFGCEAGLVPEGQRVQATVALMQQVFSLARKHGLKIIFALDVHTEASNPQNIIDSLPESARFEVDGFRLALPDVAEGYEYYKSQVSSLMRTYPEISRLALWMRDSRNTPWRSLTGRSLPKSWRAEYQEALGTKTPDIQSDPNAAAMFAIGKIAACFRRALDELGKSFVELGLGSWNFGWMPTADAFVPMDTVFTPLDYEIELGTDETQTVLQAVSKHRAVVPVVWAHHDDRGFLGRPYTPFANFASLLTRSGSAGFGIIHWTTRPLDLYFKSLAVQVWNQTKDQPLEVTCEQMAERTFGGTCRDLGKEYLIRWIMEAPMFGVDSGAHDHFLDRPLVEPERVITECRGRLNILDKFPAAGLPPVASDQLSYFQEFERFLIAFYRAHSAWERSVDYLNGHDLENSRKALIPCDPRSVIEQYARAAAVGKPTRGEMGVLISLNLKWLPYIISQRQALRLEPIRYHFGPTEHELLSQGSGNLTFFFDQVHELWKAAGEWETQFPTFQLATPPFAEHQGLREICRTGLRSDKTIDLCLKTIAEQDLLPGVYNLHLLLTSPSSDGMEDSTLELAASEREGAIDIISQIDVVRRAGGKDRALQVNLPLHIRAGSLSFHLKPIKGSIYLCGLVIEPKDALPA